MALPSGSHRLDWKLTHSSAEGQAVTAWVDSVEIRDGVAPKIMSASSNYWFTPGEPVTLSVAAAGDDPLHYQWFAGAAPIPWATANTVLLWPWDIAPELSYSVTVSNYFGVVKSGPMTLQPRPRLRIETQPAGTLRLIWPRVASGFILEASADLRSAASWEVLDHPVVLTEKECAVSVPAEPGTNRWFRLRLP